MYIHSNNHQREFRTKTRRMTFSCDAVFQWNARNLRTNNQREGDEGQLTESSAALLDSRVKTLDIDKLLNCRRPTPDPLASRTAHEWGLLAKIWSRDLGPIQIARRLPLETNCTRKTNGAWNLIWLELASAERCIQPQRLSLSCECLWHQYKEEINSTQAI